MPTTMGWDSGCTGIVRAAEGRRAGLELPALPLPSEEEGAGQRRTEALLPVYYQQRWIGPLGQPPGG